MSEHGRVQYETATDDEVIDAFFELYVIPTSSSPHPHLIHKHDLPLLYDLYHSIYMYRFHF